ncbi:unnamed protein product [Chironomus riparius]|uniref:NADH dehydrogenase [ubiquinone] 1 subunit C2 n=1 Tax=Chironomus riparius TaxID=315576 RepID=A0A9N9S5V1_9DIPT|nr:unnamed protein product [Chironomus riparius]
MGYALDLLNKDYEIQKPLSNDLYNPILLGVAGFASIAFSNFIMRRPLMSGIQRHVAVGTAGVFFGCWVNKKRDEHYAERDAVLRHYVELHPEDFPDPDKKKFGEILMRWNPIR